MMELDTRQGTGVAQRDDPMPLLYLENLAQGGRDRQAFPSLALQQYPIHK